jgi:hypothetical protein
VTLNGDLVELLMLRALCAQVMLAAMLVIKQFQHSNFAVGFHQRMAAALGLCFQKRALVRELAAASLEHQIVALRFQEPVHVHELLAYSRTLQRAKLRMLGRQFGLALGQQRVGLKGFGQGQALLIAPRLADFLQSFEAEFVFGHDVGE